MKMISEHSFSEGDHERNGKILERVKDTHVFNSQRRCWELIWVIV